MESFDPLSELSASTEGATPPAVDEVAPNLASAAVGAQVVACSSEVPGCEAANVLYDSPELVWRSRPGLPQWVVARLQPSGAPRLGLGFADVLCVGWSCDRASAATPRSVVVHASRFKAGPWRLVAELTAHGAGTHIFDLETPLAVGDEPFVRVTVAETAGALHCTVAGLVFSAAPSGNVRRAPVASGPGSTDESSSATNDEALADLLEAERRSRTLVERFEAVPADRRDAAVQANDDDDNEPQPRTEPAPRPQVARYDVEIEPRRRRLAHLASIRPNPIDDAVVRRASLRRIRLRDESQLYVRDAGPDEKTSTAAAEGSLLLLPTGANSARENDASPLVAVGQRPSAESRTCQAPCPAPPRRAEVDVHPDDERRPVESDREVPKVKARPYAVHHYIHPPAVPPEVSTASGRSARLPRQTQVPPSEDPPVSGDPSAPSGRGPLRGTHQRRQARQHRHKDAVVAPETILYAHLLVRKVRPFRRRRHHSTCRSSRSARNLTRSSR